MARKLTSLFVTGVVVSGGCAEPQRSMVPEPVIDSHAVVSLPPTLDRREFRPRVIHDSGWRFTGASPPKRYRLRIYAGAPDDRQALVVFGDIGGAEGTTFPLPELANAEQEACRFDDGDRLIDLQSGFAWVRFSALPMQPRRAASPDEPAAAWRLFSTNSLFVDPVGTEFILATSQRSRFDLVYVMSAGAVEVSERYVPGSARVRVGGGQLLRRGGGAEPTFNLEDPAAAPRRRDLAAEVLEIVRGAIEQYNGLDDGKRPTRRLNPGGSLSFLSEKPAVAEEAVVGEGLLLAPGLER